MALCRAFVYFGAFEVSPLFFMLHSCSSHVACIVCEITKKQRRQSVPTRRPRVEGGERLKGDRSTAAWSRPIPRANHSRFVERTVPPMVSYRLTYSATVGELQSV